MGRDIRDAFDSSITEAGRWALDRSRFRCAVEDATSIRISSERERDTWIARLHFFIFVRSVERRDDGLRFLSTCICSAAGSYMSRYFLKYIFLLIN